MGFKENHKAVLETGSPLSHHSINQLKIRRGDQGQRRLDQMHPTSTITEEEKPSAVDYKTLSPLLPTTEVFDKRLLLGMADLARRQAAKEQDLSIPARLVNIAGDITAIYIQAKKDGLALQITDPPTSSNIDFPLRANSSKYPGAFPYQVFVTEWTKTPAWRGVPENTKRMLVNTLPKALITNLTSCDFSLEGEEAVAERVKIYGFVLSTIALPAHLAPPKTRAQFSDDMFSTYLGLARRYFSQTHS